MGEKETERAEHLAQCVARGVCCTIREDDVMAVKAMGMMMLVVMVNWRQ